METLKFTLQGKSAFFKKPDVNSYFYFTYGNIHKVALLGIFGAILGYSGYNHLKKKGTGENITPEFYRKLKDLKVSIVPKADKGFIPKKVQVFNNSVGYASHEKGGNLIVKEQWLEDPSWDIYVLLNNEESLKIKDALINKSAMFIPYLGSNDHFADITDVKVVECNIALEKVSSIHGLYPKRYGDIVWKDNDEEDEDDDEIVSLFKYEEGLPIGLNSITNMYIMDKFVYTNMYVKVKDIDVYHCDDGNLIFY